MYHNPHTWHNCSQVKLTGEESCQRTNCKIKCKLESQSPLGNNRASATWEESCQYHLGTIVSVSFQSNRTRLTWRKSLQSRLGTIVQVSLGNNCTNVT